MANPILSVVGRRIYKDNVPYQVRGWAYYNPPIASGSGYDWTNQPTQITIDVDDMKAAGANALRIYYTTFDAEDYDTALDYCYANGMDVFIDYYVAHNTDYSVATGGANRSTVISAVSTMVTNLAYHPAIVAFGIGNEVNYELGGTSAKDWYTLVEACCQAGKAIDGTKLFTTINGDVETILGAENWVPSMDIWGANCYRGTTFTTMLRQIMANTTKPVFLGEFGYDSIDDGAEDRAGQAGRVVSHIAELHSYYPYVSGGFIFEWCDEWWKKGGGSSSVHETGGFAGADDRDGVMDEEWWGSAEVLAANANVSRTKKTVYTSVSNYWNATTTNLNRSKRLPVI